MTGSTSAGPDANEDQLGEKFWLGPVICLDGAIRSMPAHRDSGSNAIQMNLFE